MKILLVVGAVVVAVPLIVALRPSHYRVARSTTIAAPPAAVFARVNDFHEWTAWNPWQKLDPGAKNTFEGAAAGTGAIFTWSGNSEVGEGRMTIIESRPSELIRIRLDFLRPVRSTATAEFTFAPEQGQTLVTWSMGGANTFVGKAIGLVMNMDRMIGGNFEKGLAALKSLTEVAAAATRKEER